MASELGERSNETDGIKDEVKALRAANQKHTDFLQEYKQNVNQYVSYAGKISELSDLADQIPEAAENH